MKKLKVLLASVFAIMAMFSFAGCETLGGLFGGSNDFVGTYKFNAFVKMKSAVETIDGQPEIVYKEDSRSGAGDTYEMEGVGQVECYENMVVLDLNKDNTFLLIEPSGTVGGQYGKWEKDGNEITLKGKEKDYVLIKKGDILSCDLKNNDRSSYTKVELKKHEIVENKELKSVAGIYKFSSMTQSNAEQSITVNVGETLGGKTYKEDFFLVDLKANGELYILGDARWGLLYGETGTWTIEGEKVAISFKVSGYDMVYKFTLSDNTLSYNFSEDEISLSLILKK